MSPAGGLLPSLLALGWDQVVSQGPEGAAARCFPHPHLVLASFPQGLNPLGFPNGERQLETQNVLAELVSAGFQFSNLK